MSAGFRGQSDGSLFANINEGIAADFSLWQWKGDSIAVTAFATSNADVLASDLSVLGMEVSSTFAQLVTGFLPISSINALNDLGSLEFARPALKAATNIGLVTSGGDFAQRTHVMRDFAGLTGEGISIGVISDSYDRAAGSNAADDIATGDLPGPGNPNGHTQPVFVHRDNLIDQFGNPAGTDEGRAMLQIVHDVAPKGQLLFSNVSDASGAQSQSAFADNIKSLVSVGGADVVVDDVFFFEEPFFMDGLVAQAVDEVVGKGVTYFAAAGNFENDSYESSFRSSGNTEIFTVGTNQFSELLHDFDPGPLVDTRQRITVPPGTTTISFQWDDPFRSVAPNSTGAVRDFDIYLLTAGGGVINAGVGSTIGQDAVEVVGITNFNNFPLGIDIAIGLRNGANPGGFLKYIAYNPGADIFEHDTNSPTSAGHANAVGAIAVGAAFYQQTPEFGDSPAIVEGFSSLGGVNILFDVNGTRLVQPEARNTVDIVAPDGGNTTFFGLADPVGTGPYEADGFRNFFGTSAAAPHAAAISALLLQTDPGLSPAAILDALQMSATDMDDPLTLGFDVGFDARTGAGFVDALGAIGIVQNSPQLVGLAPNEYIVVNDTRDLLDADPNDGVIDVDLSPSSPGFQVSLRAATVAANAGGTNAHTLLVRKGEYDLTLSGSGPTTVGDLDITGNVTIVGTGAGETVIDAVGLLDRHFDIASGGTLDLSRLTLALGVAQNITTERDGGAIRVGDVGHLKLGYSAIVGNATGRSGEGGGVYFDSAGSGTIANSVITVNEGDDETGGVYLQSASTPGTGGTVAVINSIIAKNTGGGSPDVFAGTNRTFTSGGNNRLGNAATGFTHGLNGDHIGTANYIVSAVADTFDGFTDSMFMSLRDAIQLANNTSGPDEIWLPGWHFLLKRAGAGGTEGDLDITSPISMLGIGAGSTIINAAGLAVRDRVLEVQATGSLSLTRMTLTGGETAFDGGAIRVNNNSDPSFNTNELTLREVAIVGNRATDAAGVGNGGGVYFAPSTAGRIERSVITRNRADEVITQGGGGGIYAAEPGAVVTLNQSIVALNTATLGPDLLSIQTAHFISEGDNMFTSVAGSNLANPGNLQPSDRVDPAVSYVATSIVDSLFGDPRALSVREAIETANVNNGLHTVWLPGWHFKLLDDGDMDIYNGFTIIVGAGAGATVIDGSSLAVRDRLFEVLPTGAVHLERMTLTGGETSLDGGAIRVNDNMGVGVREITVREVAIVGNRATNAAGYGNGGGIYFAPGAAGRIEQSVITNNIADEVVTEGGGGGIYAGEPGAVVTLLETVVALNTAALGPDLLSIQTAHFISEGGNLITNTTGATFAAPGLQSSDYTNQTPGFVAPNFVVTSLMDISYRADDAWARSIRDAIFHTNSAANQTIWLPAWDFVLTQRRTAAANQVEMDSDQGDIDIKQSLTIRGAGLSGSTATVGWRTGLPSDAVFELLGDYNRDGVADGIGNGTVGSEDYNIWRDTLGHTSDLRADGNDNGVVDQADHDVWQDAFGNTLTVQNVTVA